ncbi:MAG: FG-GAP-like repeat-containing protein, partial [Deltaproteobacteria bacterium]
VNGDGYLDIVGVGYERIYWFENDGAQGFSVHVVDDLGLAGQTDMPLVAADFDGDGDVDLFTNIGGVSWYENIGGNGAGWPDGTVGLCTNPASAAGAVCRSAVDVCDAAETCDGASIDCPVDGFIGQGTAVVTDANVCTTETCGVSGEIISTNNADPCDDGDACTATDVCSGGVCAGSGTTCGNGTVEAACETCDDGNADNTDACLDTCEPASCGDGYVRTGVELCDDGTDSELCDGDCTWPVCGDDYVNPSAGETCDEGGTETATCDSNCTAAICGDEYVNTSAGELCDAGGESATCNANCTQALCGDGTHNQTAGETCDHSGESGTCDGDCTVALCGDDYVNAVAGEECDDGNNTSNDGCSATCASESGGGGDAVCGNGIDELGEQCEYGAVTGSEDCSPECEFEYEQTRDQYGCITAINGATAKFGGKRGKANSKCVKNRGKGKESDPEACLTADPRGKLQKIKLKNTLLETKSCALMVPDFGYAGSGSSHEAAVAQETALAADIFGNDLAAALIVAGKDKVLKKKSKCQAIISKSYEKLMAAKLKAFYDCKKIRFKAGGQIITRTKLGACLTADDKNKVAKMKTKLAVLALKKCSGFDLASLFPGQCSDAGDFVDCVAKRITCRSCLVLEAGDRLPALCDEFDDNQLNESCPTDTTVVTGEIGLFRHPSFESAGMGDNTINSIRHFYGGPYKGAYGQITPINGKRTIAPVICAAASVCSGDDSEGQACGTDDDCGSGGSCQECAGAPAGQVLGSTQDKFVIWYPTDAGYTLEVRNNTSEPWQHPIADAGFAAHSAVREIVTYAGANHTFVVFPTQSGNILVRLR